MLGIARIAEKGMTAAALISAAIAFLGVMTFDVSVMLGLLATPICIMLSSAVIAFVLLRHQEQSAGTTALFAGALVVFAAVLFQHNTPYLLVFIAICWIGTIVVSSVLRQTVSLKAAVLVMVPFTVIASLIGRTFKADIMHFWQSLLLESVANFSAAELDQLGPERLNVLQVSMPNMLAESVGSWAFFIVLSAVFLGRYWQAQLFNKGGFQMEFHSLRLGKEAVLAFVVSLALSQVFSVPFFAIIASVLLFVFFIQGLSVLHSIVKQRGLSRSWLTGLYVFLWLPPTMLFLGAVGMADNFFRLRNI